MSFDFNSWLKEPFKKAGKERLEAPKNLQQHINHYCDLNDLTIQLLHRIGDEDCEFNTMDALILHKILRKRGEQGERLLKEIALAIHTGKTMSHTKEDLISFSKEIHENIAKDDSLGSAVWTLCDLWKPEL